MTGKGRRTQGPRHHKRGHLPPAREHDGMVTRWAPGDGWGFITDPDGLGWFVSADDVADAELAALAIGVAVTFTGRPVPAPGKQHPRARRVRLAGQNEQGSTRS